MIKRAQRDNQEKLSGPYDLSASHPKNDLRRFCSPKGFNFDFFLPYCTALVPTVASSDRSRSVSITVHVLPNDGTMKFTLFLQSEQC